MITKNKRFIGILLVIVILLLIPFIAMQFSGEVNWSPFDFVVAAILLFGAGIMCEIALRKLKNNKYRVAACTIILVLLLIFWAELAVGIFGTPLAGS